MKKLLIIMMVFSLLISLSSAEIFPVNNEVIPNGLFLGTLQSSDTSYDYEYIGIYTAYFLDNPTTGDSIYFDVAGHDIRLQPHSFNWNNDNSQLQQISMPQAVTGSPNGNTMEYLDAYGTNIDLVYEARIDGLKEKLIINNLSDLVAPEQYVIDGGNAHLELNFNFATDTKLFVDGAEWGRTGTIQTTNDIIIKDANDVVLYTIERPFIEDATGDREYGYLELKKSGNKLYIGMKNFTYSWLQNASFPVFIDPTLSVDYSPIPGQLLIDGIATRDNDSVFEEIQDVTSIISDNNDSTFLSIYGETTYAGGNRRILTDNSIASDSFTILSDSASLGKRYATSNKVFDELLVCAYYVRTGNEIPSLNLRVNDITTNVTFPILAKSVDTYACVDATPFLPTPPYDNINVGVTCTDCADSAQKRIRLYHDETPETKARFSISAPDNNTAWGDILTSTNYVIRINFTGSEAEPLIDAYGKSAGNIINRDEELLKAGDLVATDQIFLNWESEKFIEINTTNGNFFNDTMITITWSPTTIGQSGQMIFTNSSGDANYGVMTFDTTTLNYTTQSLNLNGIPEGGIHQFFIRENSTNGTHKGYFDYFSSDAHHRWSLSGLWNETYDSNYEWFLRFRKVDNQTSNAYAVAYSSNDSINPSQTASLSADTTGWFNINVSSLLDYQANTQNLSYTKLRFYTDSSSSIAELQLRKEINDSQAPSITDCSISEQSLYDGQQTRINCTVTDNIDVATVKGHFGGAERTFTKYNDEYYYDYTCQATGTDDQQVWVNTTATDILGTQNTTLISGQDLTCIRHCDYQGTGVWNLFRTFLCEISQAFTGSGDNIEGNDIEVVWSQDIGNFTNLTIETNSTITIQNGTTVTIG